MKKDFPKTILWEFPFRTLLGVRNNLHGYSVKGTLSGCKLTLEKGSSPLKNCLVDPTTSESQALAMTSRRTLGFGVLAGI